MAKQEIIILGIDGKINAEMFGFQGKNCLIVAKNIAEELRRLGVVTEIDEIKLKDTDETIASKQTIQETIEA